MNTLRETVVGQFGHPRGILGHLAGLVMTLRPSNRIRNRRTLDLLEIRPGDHVLEVGFGPGLSIERALRLAGRGTVTGLDHSELMLRLASRRNAPDLAEGRLHLLLGSAEHLPPFAVRFDKVFAVNVFMFWTDPVDVLRGLRAVMKPGGALALTLQPRNRRATNEDTRAAASRMSAALREAGFKDVRVEILDMKPVAAACALGTA